jgi:malate dehydrogenase (oxaloacetate-decarboxylating)
MNFDQKALKAHKKLRGKLRIENADSLDSQEKLSIYYTPGVGAVAKYIYDHPKSARELTGLNNTVAVITDGSAVLGLGNIGAQPALPVMEGKAMLFKQFAGINAFPIVLNTQNPDEIVAAIKAIAPSFGGINLEDITAPVCFEVEARLKAILPIPVFHDDQHGTAIVVLAGLINAAQVVNKDIKKLSIVISGAGAAGQAVTKLLHKFGIKQILVLDSQGIISRNQSNLRPDKKVLAGITNPGKRQGNLKSAIKGADVFIGVSKPGILHKAMISTMAKDPIIFALSNPVPEIMPSVALAAGAKIVASGRSDFANQVNNALVFPAIFRGALDNRVRSITDEHKLSAAQELASLVSKPTPSKIIPVITDKRILKTISQVIK